MAPKPMTKTQLVPALAEAMCTAKKTASAAHDALVGLITRELSRSGAGTLPRVGKIYFRVCLERTVRHPATAAQINNNTDHSNKKDVHSL